jgi:hypothetical protein
VAPLGGLAIAIMMASSGGSRPQRAETCVAKRPLVRLGLGALLLCCDVQPAAPQRSQHESAAPPSRSAVVAHCATVYDSADRTLSVFHTVRDCLRREDADVWRQTIPVMEPSCGDPAAAPAVECTANGLDSSYLNPCVTTHDGQPAVLSGDLSEQGRGLAWRMSFFSGMHCDLDAAGLVLLGRLNECDACEVDATGGGISHRHAHAFHSLVADGIASDDELAVIHEGSWVHEAARRDAEGQAALVGEGEGSWDDAGSGGEGADFSMAPDTLGGRWAASLLVLLAALGALLLAFRLGLRPKTEGQPCACSCCGGRTCWLSCLACVGGAGAGVTTEWHSVAQEDSVTGSGVGSSGNGGNKHSGGWELDDIM